MADDRTLQSLPSVAELNALSPGAFPGYVGFQVVEAAVGRVRAELEVSPHLHAPNGYLHAGVVVTLADTACGYGVRTCLPVGAKGFTTIELKSNFLGTVLEGPIWVDAALVHGGKRTQVWDATVRAGRVPAARGDASEWRVLALFRCTQMVLW